MNRQNLVVHGALALTLVLAAAFVGQVQRWNGRQRVRESRVRQDVVLGSAEEIVVAPPRAERRTGDEPEVLVRFRAGTTSDEIERIAGRLNDRVEDEIESVRGLVAIDDRDGLTAAMVAGQYSGLAEVEYVEENYDGWSSKPLPGRRVVGGTFAAPVAGPNDPMFAEQWALSNDGRREGKSEADIAALTAWAKTHGNSKVVVAVLDSGVDYTHKDLAENMWIRPAGIDPYVDEQLGEIDDLHGFDAVAADGLPDPMDENGHGTHCAGIIGAVGNNGEGIAGVNWKIEVMPLRFMSAGGFGTTKDAIEAINYVIDRKRAGVNVRVISASWGSTRRSQALEDVIRKAGEEGIIFIAAAGNSSVNTDTNPHYPSSYKLPNVMSIAALDRRDQLAGFSNFGAKSVHLAAPGKEILSTWLRDAYEEHSGTSMATPVVSGVAALILSCEPELKVEQLKQRLMDTADKLDALNGKTVSGGRVNAARAVGAVK
ncbi:MAG TPA: S8 family serine peptidase [Pyrinomonadaceae bacterium]